MKSSARDFGAKTLASMAQELEQMGKSAQLVGAESLVEKARKEYAKVECHLKALPNEEQSE